MNEPYICTIHDHGLLQQIFELVVPFGGGEVLSLLLTYWHALGAWQLGELLQQLLDIGLVQLVHSSGQVLRDFRGGGRSFWLGLFIHGVPLAWPLLEVLLLRS